MNASFSREERIRKRGEFLRISDSGNRLSTAHFIVLWRQSGHAQARLGVTVSRKVGNAVIRNRVKRLLREFFRLNKGLFPVADYNIIGKRGADRLSYHALCAEVGKALQSIRNRTCSSGF